MLKDIAVKIRRTRDQILKESRDPCLVCGTSNARNFSARLTQSKLCVRCNQSPSENVKMIKAMEEMNRVNECMNSCEIDSSWVHDELRSLGIYVTDYNKAGF